MNTHSFTPRPACSKLKTKATLARLTLTLLTLVFLTISSSAWALTTTTTTLSPASDSTTYGTSSTITATVAGTGGTPTGTVQFKTNGVAFGSPVTLSGGTSTIQSALLPVLPGAYTISATYSGDATFATSSTTSSSTLTVFPLPVTLNKVYDGTATASSANLVIGNIQPGDAGNVTFTGSATLGSANLGSQTFSTAIGMPQLVQTIIANNHNSSSAYTVTLPAVTGGGNYALIAAISSVGNATKYATITDSLGSSWAQVANGQRDSGTHMQTEIQYAKNVSGASANTITITPSGGNASSIVIMQYSGLTATPLDKTAALGGTAATSPVTLTGPTMPTTSQANELWIAACGVEVGTSGVFSSPTGFSYLTKSQYGTTAGSSANNSVFVLVINSTSATGPACGGTCTYASGSTAMYNSVMAATFKAANTAATPLVLSGSAAGNYTLAGVTTATITAKPLNVGLVNSTKVYDGATTATLLTTTPTLLPAEASTSGNATDGKPYTGDTINFTGTVTAASYNTKDVATANTILFTGLTIDNANYTLNWPATITARPIVLSGSKTYDGTASVPASGLVIGNYQTGDSSANLTVTGTGGLGSRNAGSRTVALAATPTLIQSANGATPNGNGVSSYTVTLPSDPVAGDTLIVVTGTGTTTANWVTGVSGGGGTWSSGVASGGSYSPDASIWYAPNISGGAGNRTITITLQGTGKSSEAFVMEYNGLAASPLDTTATTKASSGTALSSGTLSTTAQASELVVTGLGVAANATTVSGVTSGYALAGTAINPSAVYVYTNVINAVGTPSVTGTASASGNWSGMIASFKAAPQLALSGAVAGDYTLTGMTATETISAEPVTVTAGTTAKTYDGTANSSVSPTITSGAIMGGDVASFTQSFSDRNVGTSKTLTPSGTVTDGNSGNNYSYTFTPQNNGTINAKALTVSGITAASTVYDATTTAKLGGSAAFLTAEAAGSGTTSDGKPYTVDSVSPGTVTGTLAAKDVGTQNVTTIVAVNGAGSGNYTVNSQAGLTQNVTAKPLNFSGIYAANKAYDGGVSATFAGTASTLSDEAPGTGSTSDGTPYTGDTVSFMTGTLTGSFATSDVANNILVSLTSGVTLASGGQSADYSVSSPQTALTANITKAATSVGASSSENPSGNKDSVFFLATLPSDATGSVVFSSTNGPISTNSVSSGSATSLSITCLPRGTNVITFAYLGDDNYVGSTNTLDQIVTNHPPVAAVMTVTRTAGLALIIALSDVATNWTDSDSDHVSLTGVSMQSTNGINLFALNWSTNLDGSIVTTNAYAFIGYTNSPNVNDQISYTISDGQGGTNLGYINIVIQGSVTGTNSITGLDFSSPNSNTVTAYGIPYFYYTLERSTNLTSPVWVDVSTNQAAANGVINAVDTFWDLGGVKPSPTAFYQLKWQP